MTWQKVPPRVKQYEGTTAGVPSVPYAPLRIADTRARLTVPIPKRQYVRSPKLMKAYGKIACQRCGAVNQTVCGAHSNWAIHGKGKSIKADDNRCASLCGACHHDIDQGKELSESGRQIVWWAAHVRTVMVLVKLNRWPAGVPLPDIGAFPKEWT